MEEKNIDKMLLGEKIGRTMQLSESIEKTLTAFIEKCDKRFCACEEKEREHALFIANAKGKVTILGIIWGGISGIGSALLVWYLTR
jgi:hypothetical protein